MSGPFIEDPIPTSPPLQRRYRAAVVGYREVDGGPREVMVDIETTTGETVASMTVEEAAVLGVELVAEAHQARTERATEPGA